ncbi:MAG: electron transport complex subunit RsxC [Clostridia bacterium]|nr:electron transport complex subunit RsxC [Clostridia bacterium]
MKRTFMGGVHPLSEIHEGKRPTQGLAVRPVTSAQVVIPVGQHIGAPSAPCVKKGDNVLLGQVIAEPVGGLGIPVHASVSGTVLAVEERQQLRAKPEMCIVIENDMQDNWTELTPVGEVESVDPTLIAPAVKAAGICGMGGAAFPTHVKLAVPEGKTVDTVILNGCECEPYLTADHRQMLENADRIADGLRLIMRATGVKKAFVAIEDNKPDAISVMEKALAGREGCEVAVLKTKYPQGGEKTLIQAVTGREVPRGGLPADAGVLVFNVSTAAAIADAVVLGKPLVERIVTVTGNVNEPANLLVRIGTSVEEVANACGGFKEDTRKVIFGGPMTGIPAPDTTVSIAKNNNGLVAFNEKEAKQAEEQPCIRCGRCAMACSIHLQPFKIAVACRQGKLDLAKEYGLMDCVLCGACSYICPAQRHLTVAMKTAKEELAAKARR